MVRVCRDDAPGHLIRKRYFSAPRQEVGTLLLEPALLADAQVLDEERYTTEGAGQAGFPIVLFDAILPDLDHRVEARVQLIDRSRGHLGQFFGTSLSIVHQLGQAQAILLGVLGETHRQWCQAIAHVILLGAGKWRLFSWTLA